MLQTSMLRYLTPIVVAAMLVGIGTTAAYAQTADTNSEACREALETVKTLETRALSVRQEGAAAGTQADGTLAGLQAARERAARLCLGGSGREPAAQHIAQPPISVPPVTPTTPRMTRPATAPAPVPVPVLPQRSDIMTTVTACDPGGCWASDGTRLNRVGSNLVGPHGTCTLQGPVVRCP